MFFNEIFPHKRNDSARCKILREKKRVVEYFPSFSRKPNGHINVVFFAERRRLLDV